MKRALFVLVTLVLIGCDGGPSGPRPDPVREGAVAFDAPRAWWAEVVACSPQPPALTYEQVEFFVLPAVNDRGEFACSDQPDGTCMGAWDRPNRIYVGGPNSHRRALLQHFMAHAVTADRSHDPAVFRSTCSTRFPHSWAPI